MIVAAKKMFDFAEGFGMNVCCIDVNFGANPFGLIGLNL